MSDALKEGFAKPMLNSHPALRCGVCEQEFESEFLSLYTFDSKVDSAEKTLGFGTSYQEGGAKKKG